MSEDAIQLRLAHPVQDAAACLEIYRPYIEDNCVSFELETPSQEAFCARMTSTMQTYPWLVAEVGGEVVGYAYACSHRSRAAYQYSVEVSVYINPAQHRRGSATRLYRLLFALLSEQGFLNAYAGITLPNPASERFHAAMGFKPVGTYPHVGFKKGRWRDVAWSGLTLKSPPASPPPPRALPTLPASVLDALFKNA